MRFARHAKIRARASDARRLRSDEHPVTSLARVARVGREAEHARIRVDVEADIVLSDSLARRRP